MHIVLFLCLYSSVTSVQISHLQLLNNQLQPLYIFLANLFSEKHKMVREKSGNFIHQKCWQSCVYIWWSLFRGSL